MRRHVLVLSSALALACSPASSARPPSAAGSDSGLAVHEAAAHVEAGTGGELAHDADESKPRDAGPRARDAGHVERVHDAGDDASVIGTGPLEPTDCPDVLPVAEVGMLGDAALTEASGLVASRSNVGVLWLHNDSGDGPRIFALSEQGEPLAQISLSGANAIDWEDIGIGPGPVAGAPYLYVGDIGDNDEKRASVQIYRVREPVLDAQGHAPASVTAERLDVTYEDGAHDAETLLVDPLRGDVYLVGKASFLQPNATVGVYRIAADAFASGKAVAERVADVAMGPATGGDVLPDGTGVAIRSYWKLSYWARDPAEPLYAAFEARSCALELEDKAPTQGEAFGFAADGRGYYTTAEGAKAKLWFYAFP